MPLATFPCHATNHSTSLAAFAAVLSIAASARGQWIFVDDSAPPGGDGRSWDSPFNDLQDALDLASATSDGWGTYIRLAQGTYKPGHGSGDRMSSFHVDRRTVGSAMSIQIQGGYAGYGAQDPNLRDAAFVSVLSGDLRGDDTPGFAHREDNAQRILDLKGFNWVHLSGLTIRGANALDADDPVVLNVEPAGIPSRGDLGMYNITLEGNEAAPAGSLVRVRGTSLSFDAGSIIDNRANILDFQHTDISVYSQSSLYSSVIRNNTGGVFRSTTTASLNSCWILSNGSWNDSGSAVVSDGGFIGNCFVAGNITPSTWWNSTGRVIVWRSTLTANTTGGDVSLIKTSAEMGLYGSILYGNTIGAHGMLGIGKEAYFYAEFCDIENGKAAIDPRQGSIAWGKGNINQDPRLAGLAGADGNLATWDDNNLQLAADSPCIDASDPQMGRSEDDLLGNPRAVDGNGDSTVVADIGVIEYQPPKCRADISNDGVVDDEDLWSFWQVFVSAETGYFDNAPDFNHDGFVTGDDWDEFIAAFTAGC